MTRPPGPAARRPSTVLVVGASVGGVRTASALRAAGHDGPIVLVGAEPDLPYDKPPLSKAMLLGDRDDPHPLLTREQAAAAGVTLELGVAAARLDLAGSHVELADGRCLPFDHLVVATGAAARPSPWGDPEGLQVLRTLADARALGAAMRGDGRLVVIGGGFIGAEVASAARARGREVSIVDPLPVPMGRILGEEIGRLFVDLHHRNGTRTRFGTGVERVERVGTALRLTLTDGTTLEGETVVVGIGAVVNDGWLRSSGLALDDGVLCDEYSRSVTHPWVHAVGDVARWRHLRHGESVRVEHWTNAVEQASCVAHNITHPDEPRPYAPVEYVWSDQYDWKIQIVGRPLPDGAPVRVDGGGTGDRFATFWADPAGNLSGSMSVNWPKATLRGRRGLAPGEPMAAVLEDLSGVWERATPT